MIPKSFHWAPGKPMPPLAAAIQKAFMFGDSVIELGASDGVEPGRYDIRQWSIGHNALGDNSALAVLERRSS